MWSTLCVDIFGEILLYLTTSKKPLLSVCRSWRNHISRFTRWSLDFNFVERFLDSSTSLMQLNVVDLRTDIFRAYELKSVRSSELAKFPHLDHIRINCRSHMGRGCTNYRMHPSFMDIDSKYSITLKTQSPKKDIQTLLSAIVMNRKSWRFCFFTKSASKQYASNTFSFARKNNHFFVTTNVYQFVFEDTNAVTFPAFGTYKLLHAIWPKNIADYLFHFVKHCHLVDLVVMVNGKPSPNCVRISEFLVEQAGNSKILLPWSRAWWNNTFDDIPWIRIINDANDKFRFIIQNIQQFTFGENVFIHFSKSMEICPFFWTE